MRSAALELRVTVESPTSPACQGMEMDWLIYVFADFSSEPSAASMNSGSTLQTQNCHLGASYVSTLLYTIFFLCVPSMFHWKPLILDTETLPEFEEIKVLDIN